MINDENLLSQYVESKRIIRQAMYEHQLVLFVGAGASIASGMPTWGSAIKIIADRLSIHEDQPDYLRIPQYYYNARGKKEYTKLIRSIFKHGEYLIKHEIHDRIIEFNTETIITTNYDHLIEQAAEDNSQFLSVVSKDTDLPYRKGNKELIKMHGDFENDNFVLKEDDYLAYSRNFKLIENYVKSLIGTKVILFIGYSFNDPDLKLIFSWVKDILGGDFRRAYLIDAGRKYDVNEAEYFRNLGINILYASFQLNDKYDKDNLTNNLLLMLKWLLNSDEIDKLTTLYNDLKPFASMNYASQKYINNALLKAGIKEDNGKLYIHMMEAFTDDTEIIFKSLAYEQWLRLGKNILLPQELFYRKVDNEKEEKILQQEHNNSVAKYFNGFKIEKGKQKIIGSILDILNKSNVKFFETYLPIHNSENGLLPLRIPLSDITKSKWLDCVDTFDYSSLKKIAEDNYSRLSSAHPELYMEQGYIQFTLENYLASYNCYKNAKNLFYKRHEYEKFFVAEFSRYIIGMMISRLGMFSRISQEDIALVKEEFHSINLDRMFNSIPDLGESNKILKDIYTFNSAYTIFQDAYKAYEKVNEQAKTRYFIFGGTAAFAEMRKNVEDYYRYISMNLLPVNKYEEQIHIFRIYFQSILNSVSTPDDEDNTNRKTIRIHADELERFDLLVALKFIDGTSLDKILNDVLGEIKISDSATEYLFKVLLNCSNTFPQNVLIYDNPFWKCITILGCCNLSCELTKIGLNKLIELTAHFDYQTHASKISKFLINAHTNDCITEENIKLVEEFLLKEFELLASDKLEYANLIQNELWILHEHDKPFDNVDVIKPLIVSKSKLLLVTVYKLLGDNCRIAIKKAYKNWSFEEKNQDFDFYYQLVANGIQRPSTEIEKTIYDYYKNYMQKEVDISEFDPRCLSTQDDENYIYKLLDLYIKDLIINKKLCLKLIMARNIEGAEWLMNYKDYDYTKFNINWLKICSETLLEDICKNKKVKIIIRKSIEKKYKYEKIDPAISKLYFKHIV